MSERGKKRDLYLYFGIPLNLSFVKYILWMEDIHVGNYIITKMTLNMG